MFILDSLRDIKKRFSKYSHTIEVEISKNNILNNIREYKTNYPDLLFAPVLKSNAYGHGLKEVAKILDKEKLPFFVVDSLFEARFLKHNKIKTDILIIGFTLFKNIENYNSKNFIFTITSLEELKILSEKINKSLRIHLKVDTGMRRQGILFSEINEAISLIKKNQNLILEGVCSHFASADEEDKTFTNKQIKIWQDTVEIFKDKFTFIKYFHISATSGVESINKDFTNLVRLGIGLYGVNLTNNLKLNLKPALRMISFISSIKELKAGESVGYNNTFISDKDIKIASIPVGYYEGIDRRLSNIGYLKIGEDFSKILGRVSMNISSIDVSNLKDISSLKIGDKVVIISEKEEDENSILNISKKINSIPYEVLIHIPKTLYRKVIKNF